jgi:uncharacterized protein YjbI with pentapeptide repeats
MTAELVRELNAHARIHTMPPWNKTSLAGHVLVGVRGSGLDLTYQNLSCSILKDSTLDTLNLSGSNLSGAKVENTKVTELIAKRANFSRTSFTNSVVARLYAEDTTFTGANFTDFSFKGARLSGAKFVSCVLRGANFMHAFLDGVRFQDCELDDVEFGGNARMEGTRFCTHTHVDNYELRALVSGFNDECRKAALNSKPLPVWEGPPLYRAVLTYMDLSHVNFENCDLEGTNFLGSKMYRARLTKANCNLTTFVGVDLSTASVAGAYGLPVLSSTRE